MNKFSTDAVMLQSSSKDRTVTKQQHVKCFMTGTARTQSRLTKITRPSYPHLGQSQGSTQPQCNGRASTWGNRLLDHGNPYAR